MKRLLSEMQEAGLRQDESGQTLHESLATMPTDKFNFSRIIGVVSTLSSQERLALVKAIEQQGADVDLGNQGFLAEVVDQNRLSTQVALRDYGMHFMEQFYVDRGQDNNPAFTLN